MAKDTARARRIALFAPVALVACGQAFCLLQLFHVPLLRQEARAGFGRHAQK